MKRPHISGRQALAFGLGLLLAFVASNIAITQIFSDKSLPNTYVAGKDFSGKSQDEIIEQVENELLKARAFEISFQDKNETVKAADTGIILDKNKLNTSLENFKQGLPLYQAIKRKSVDVTFGFDESAFAEFYKRLKPVFEVAPKMPSLSWQKASL